MISPQKWFSERPGMLIPVFFLCLSPGFGQEPWHAASILAAGGCFVSRNGTADACGNQAGLGWIPERSFTLHHSRPFLLSELGISSLDLQLPAGTGGFGALFSTCGLKGFRQLSAWIAYGRKLGRGLSAGAGLFLRDHAVEEGRHHPGAGCALGIQARPLDNLILGIHVMHPVSWAMEGSGLRQERMVISAGCSYTFFRSVTYHSDLHVRAGSPLQWSHGLELYFNPSTGIMIGLHNAPLTLSGGFAFVHKRWTISMAVASCPETGFTSACSFTYAW
jgi:hypothetical protein